MVHIQRRGKKSKHELDHCVLNKNVGLNLESEHHSRHSVIQAYQNYATSVISDISASFTKIATCSAEVRGLHIYNGLMKGYHGEEEGELIG